MRGDIADFKGKIGQTMQNALKDYRFEFEIALGPAKLTIRPVPVNAKNQEQEIVEGR